MRLHFALPFLIIFAFFSCEREESKTGFALATICKITLFEHGKPQVYSKIFNRLNEIENLMSARLEGSDVDKINKAAGKNPVTVHGDVFFVIENARHYAEISRGAFDPAIGPIVSLWDIGGESEKVPLQKEIESLLPLINWKDIVLDSEKCSVFLTKSGMAIDLGAIAKGYAADEIAAIIKTAGIPRAIIDLGGNILFVGKRKDKKLWRVGIQDPRENRGDYIGIAQIKDETVVTSGVYERFFELDGIRYHHIFSPKNGYPVNNGLLSATIITGVSMNADALSTAIFVLGYEEGRALVESLSGVEAIFVFADNEIKITSGIDFTVTDTDYRLIKEDFNK